MRRFAELLTALAEARGPARRVWLAEYLGETPDPDRGWAVGWLLGALPAPRIPAARLRKLAEARVGAELFRLSARALGEVGETAALIWPGGGELPLAEVAACWDEPEGLFDRLDAEGRVALVRLWAGRRPKGARFAEIRDALAALAGGDAAAVAGALAAEAPPYPRLFAWIAGGGAAPAAGPPRPPALTVLSADRAPEGPRDAYAVWPLPPGAPVRVAGGRVFDADGAPRGAAAPDGWGFLSDEGYVPAPETAPLSGAWDEIRDGPLLLRRGGDWLVWPAPERRLVCPVSFIELGRVVALTLAVRVSGEEAPLVKLPAPDQGAAARFARGAAVARFGPVRQVRPGLWAEVAYARAVPAPRRKCGLSLENPRLIRVLDDGPEPPDIGEV